MSIDRLQVLKDWINEYWRDVENYGATQEMVDELAAALLPAPVPGIIDYSAESRRIYELVDPSERADCYASLASRLREERDALLAEVERLKSIAPPQ